MAAPRASAPAVQSSSFSPWGVGSFESGGSSGSRSGTPTQPVSPSKVQATLPTMAAVTILEPAFPDETHARPLFGMLTDHLDQMVRINTWPALRLPFNVQHGTVLTLRLFRTPPSSTEGFSEFDFVAGLQVPVGKLLAMGNPLQCWCALSADIGTLVADFDDRAGAAMEVFKAVRQKATYEICPKVFIALRPLRQEQIPRSLLVGESTATPLSVSGSASMLRSNLQLSPLSSVPGWDQSPSQTDALLMARVTPQRTRSNSPSASIQVVQAELSAERQQLLKDISALTAEAQRQSATTRVLSAHEESALKEEQRRQGHLELRERLAELQQEKPLKKLPSSSASSRAEGANPVQVLGTAAPALREAVREAQDERQQISTLRFELRAERDRFKALQQSTDVEKNGINRHMSELYEMLEAERKAVSLWQEDSLEAQLSWCGDRARWRARVESLQSELVRLENDEVEAAASPTTSCIRLDFHFDKLHFEEVDSEVFRNEFVLGLGMLGVTPALLGRLSISFREGSVIAGVEGSAAAINDLKRLLLAGKVSVMGSVARVEEAMLPGEAENADLKQRAAALAQECEVLKGRRLYEDLYTRYEALEREHEALQNRSGQTVDLSEHEALKLTHRQLEEEQEARALESSAMSATDYHALQDRLKSLSVELEALEKECACRIDSKEHEALQREYEALQREHQSLRSDAEALKSRAETLESRVPRSISPERRSISVVSSPERRSIALSELEGLQSKNKGLEGKHEILERECEDLRRTASQLDAISSENSELKDRCDRLQHEIGELRLKTTSTVDADRHVDLERRFEWLSQEHKELAQENNQLKELREQLMRGSDASALRAQEDVDELRRGCRALEAELRAAQRSHEVEMQSLQDKHDSLNLRLENENQSLRVVEENEHKALQVQNRDLESGHKQMSKEMEREHQNFSNCRQILQERFDSSQYEMHETFLEEMQAAQRMHALKLAEELEAAQRKHERAIDAAQKAHSHALSECERKLERNLEQAEKALERRWEAELREECSQCATAVVTADAAGSARATSALQGRVEMLKGELRDFQAALQQERERSATEESGALEAVDQLTLAREAMESMEEQLIASQIPAANNFLLLEQEEESHAACHLELRELQEAEAQDNKKREEIDSVRAQILGTIEARVSMLQDEVMRERDLYGYHAGHGAKLENQFEELRAYTEERDQQLQELQAICEDPEMFRDPDDAAFIANLRSESADARRVEKHMQDVNSQLLTEYRVAESILAAKEPMLCDSRQELAAAEAENRLLRQELLDQQRPRGAVNAAKGPVIQRTPSFEVIHGNVFDSGAFHDQEGSTAALSAASSRPSTPHTADSHGRSHFRRIESSASSVSAASAVDRGEAPHSPPANGEFLALPPPSKEEVQWVVELDRSAGDALGIDLHGASLLIDAVMEGGLFAQWNKANPFQAVRAFDRIRSVNGRLRSDDIIAEMQDYKQLSITMVRDTSADDEASPQPKSKPSSPGKGSREATVVHKFVVDSADPASLSVNVGERVQVLSINAQWAQVKAANGVVGEVPLMCLELEGSPTSKPARRPSVASPPAKPAVRSTRRSSNGGFDAPTQNSTNSRRDRVEQKPRPSSQSSDGRTRRRDSASGPPNQRLSQSNSSTPKSSAPKSPGSPAVPPAVGSPQVERKRTGSLSRSGSAMSLGSGSASDQRSNPGTIRSPIKAKASSKAAAERKGLDVFMASLRG